MTVGGPSLFVGSIPCQAQAGLASAAAAAAADAGLGRRIGRHWRGCARSQERHAVAAGAGCRDLVSVSCEDWIARSLADHLVVVSRTLPTSGKEACKSTTSLLNLHRKQRDAQPVDAAPAADTNGSLGEVSAVSTRICLLLYWPGCHSPACAVCVLTWCTSLGHLSASLDQQPQAVDL